MEEEEKEAIRDWRNTERKKDPQGPAARPLYLAAEKILSKGEILDSHWPIDGTSGYDFLNCLNGLFIWEPGRRKLKAFYKTIVLDQEQTVAQADRHGIAVVALDAEEATTLARRHGVPLV